MRSSLISFGLLGSAGAVAIRQANVQCLQTFDHYDVKNFVFLTRQGVAKHIEYDINTQFDGPVHCSWTGSKGVNLTSVPKTACDNAPQWQFQWQLDKPKPGQGTITFLHDSSSGTSFYNGTKVFTADQIPHVSDNGSGAGQVYQGAQTLYIGDIYQCSIQS